MGQLKASSFLIRIAKMLLLLWIIQIFYLAKGDEWNLPPMEAEHYPYGHRPPASLAIAGTKFEVPSLYKTPDFRYEERPFAAYNYQFYREEERPYRFSPFYKSYLRWDSDRPRWFQQSNSDNPYNLGCYCTTVYKRLTPLAGCAVITTRHILTTATSTELILKDHKEDHTLVDILGAWYDHNADVYNSSMYMTPARIHYHPMYLRPELVNISHPLPVVFDLAVWAATYRFYGSYFTLSTTAICLRGSSGWFEYSSSTPKNRELAIIVGYQFMKAYKRVPMPWFKYVVRTRKHWPICPKTDWGWFHCVNTYWAKFGLDSGAAWHRALEGYGWRYDGLIGLAAISMKLRSLDLVGYFTVLDSHPVLDFLYSAYMGWFKCEWLDWRFYDTSGHAPIPKPWFYIPWTYDFGEEVYEGYTIPYY